MKTTDNLALITGGQKGIGLGIAHALIEDGWDVALASSSPEDHPDVVAALNKLGKSASYYQHDLLNISGIVNLLDRIEVTQGSISSLINNAGVPARVRGDMLEILPENYDFTMGINLKGAFFLAQEVAKRMQLLNPPEGHYHSIIFVTSVSASIVSVERAEYCISKAGASMMAKLFAARLAGDGIGVFELRPGIIKTAMTEKVAEKYDALIEEGLVPAQRWGEPADIGDVVSPIVNGKMHFANGAVIPVDGGLSIHRL